MSNVAVVSSIPVSSPVPVTSRSWYVVLDCADGCGYSRLCLFVFAHVHDADYANAEAHRVLGDSFPCGSTLYPVYGHWLDFIKTVHVLFSDYTAFFSLSFDADRFSDWVGGCEH